MKATPYYRRHPLLSALISLVTSLTVLLAVVLYQLDLGQLRQQLTQELSQILKQPVQMEKLHLTYQQGLAINIHNLNIGDKKSLDIKIPQLTGVLRLKPLLDGDLLLDRVVLSSPQFTVALPEGTASTGRDSASATAGQLFKRFGISLLTVRQAHLELKQDQTVGQKFPSRIENLNLVLRGWTTEQNGYLVVSGELPQHKGLFTVETELPPPAQLVNWRKRPLKIKADLKQISRELAPERIAHHIPEQIDATLHLNGSLASGVEFSGQFNDTRSRERLFKTEGRWISSNQTDTLQNLKMILYEVPLEGRLQINRTADDLIWQGSLSTENISLPPLLKRWNHPQAEKLTSGILKEAEVYFSGRTSKSFEMTVEQPPQYQVRLRVENGRWALNDTDRLEQITLDARLDNQLLELSNGTLKFHDQDFTFDGQIRNWKDSPFFSLDATVRPEIDSLRKFLPFDLPEKLVLGGSIPTSINLEGNRELIRGELQATLDDLRAEYNPLIIKKTEQKSSLSIKGTWQSGRVDIETAQLDLGKAHLEGSATVPFGNPDRSLSLKLHNSNLAALRPYSPLLQRLKARGGISVELQRKEAGDIQGNLDLDNVGAYLIWLIGDINAASGQIRFDQQGLDFKKLNVSLGQSPLEVDGTLRDWKNFLLDLQVRGTEIHARDLVFSNPEVTIPNLDGRLLINKGGIIFDPVRLRLDNGTDAAVFGYVRDFSSPDTFLEIDSFQHADILEVISLFKGPQKGKPKNSTHKGKPIRIQARVAQGILGGMMFHDAEGTIVVDKGLFTLYPLRFKHKDGFCLSRVEVEQGRLKVSGHLEDFDAATLHSEVFKAQGLVTGQLRGDFYLEGNGIGEKFWASSRGGAHLEVRNGVLRKFRGLARVFSLLNVSQLFELKLPDMDRKGMPFSLLTASVLLEDGVISTDNLQIKSNAMNMSLIGSRSLVDSSIDMTVGVKPLRTVDKIITAIPVAGWLLAGEEKALITAHFKVEGPADDPSVTAIPASSLSKTVLGVLKRTLGLPGTLVTDPEKLFFPRHENPQPGTNPDVKNSSALPEDSESNVAE